MHRCTPSSLSQSLEKIRLREPPIRADEIFAPAKWPSRPAGDAPRKGIAFADRFAAENNDVGRRRFPVTHTKQFNVVQTMMKTLKKNHRIEQAILPIYR